MDINAVTTLVGSLGFPIACCLGMFYMWNKEREEHKAECDKLTEAVANNTLVMQQILDEMRG